MLKSGPKNVLPISLADFGVAETEGSEPNSSSPENKDVFLQ